MFRRLLADCEDISKTAIIENDLHVSYAALIGKAQTLGARLIRTGYDRVAVLLPNSGDYIAAVWGAAAAGFTVFPLNVLMTAHETAPLLTHARVGVIVTTTAFRGLIRLLAPLVPYALTIVYTEELAEPETVWESAEIATDVPAVFFATSGTTGNCKIVQLSERNIEASFLGYLDKLAIEKSETDARFLLAVPFSSAYGMMVLSACLLRSFPVVITCGPFTPDSLYRVVERHKVTHYEGSASIVSLMEHTAGKTIPYNINSLRCIAFGGSKVSGDTIKKLQGAFPDKEFYQGYGMTEASPLISKHRRGTVHKTDSVGTAIKGVEIAIESDGEVTTEPNVMGEILVRGGGVMPGYYENEPETRRALRFGYLHTGDIGYLDGEGHLYICGRKKNLIIVRGFNVFPEEVEECLKICPLVEDCVVYGMAGGRNEIVCADIVPSHPNVSADDIRVHCAALLAEYKLPARIAFCKRIKKSASGKTERRRRP